jgi:hypothetical protein
MATKNDITGDSLISKKNSESYRNNFESIFKKKEVLTCEICGVQNATVCTTENSTDEVITLCLTCQLKGDTDA